MTECLMDFPHLPSWCPACYEENQRAQIIAGQQKANELKEWELGIMEEGLGIRREPRKWVEPKVRQPSARASYTPPAQLIKPSIPGGMTIEPRRNT
jgi:hypothetical protein